MVVQSFDQSAAPRWRVPQRHILCREKNAVFELDEKSLKQVEFGRRPMPLQFGCECVDCPDDKNGEALVICMQYAPHATGSAGLKRTVSKP